MKIWAFTTNKTDIPLAVVYRIDIRWAGWKQEDSIISLKPYEIDLVTPNLRGKLSYSTSQGL